MPRSVRYRDKPWICCPRGVASIPGSRGACSTRQYDPRRSPRVRFVSAAIAGVLSLLLLLAAGIHIAVQSSTTSVTASGTYTSEANYAVVPSEVLTANAGSQNIVLTGDGKMTVMVGRSGDVAAWLGEAKHADLMLSEDKTSLTAVEAGSKAEQVSPAGSDLWTEEITGDGEVKLDADLPPGYAVLIASDNGPALSTATMTWPLSNRAQWSGPLLVAAGILALCAIALLVWALLGRRERRRELEPTGEEPMPVKGSLTASEDADEDTQAEEAVATEPSVTDEPDIVDETDVARDTELVEEPEVAAASEAEAADAAEHDDSVDTVDEAEPTETADEPETHAAEMPAESEIEAEVSEDPAQEQEHDEPAPVSDDTEDAPTTDDDSTPPAPTPPAAPEEDEEAKWRRPRGRNRSKAPKRIFSFAPLLLASSLVLTGCSADMWPEALGGAAEHPHATASSEAEQALINEGAPTPALGQAQLDRILADVRRAASEGDEKKDTKLLESRFAGVALIQRQMMYQANIHDPEQPMPAAIPEGDTVYSVPVASPDWPRTVITVIKPTDQKVLPQALTLVQESAREPFKVNSVVELTPQAQLPDAAPLTVGSKTLAEVTPGLSIAPETLAAAYGDVVLNGDKSPHFAAFDTAGDALLPQIGEQYRAGQTQAIDANASTIEFKNQPSKDAPVGVASLDDGALVSVTLEEVETISAKTRLATIKVTGTTAALAGKNTSQKGFEKTYSDQLLFYVPPVSSGGKIQLLGYAQTLTNAHELS